MTEAPGNEAPIGGLKVTTRNAWFAARPSGTEDVYKIYAESFRGAEHLAAIFTLDAATNERLLAERPGYLRLHALPAKSFWEAKNSLTQRAIGPKSSPTVALDVAGLKDGDVAGLAQAMGAGCSVPGCMRGRDPTP